MSSEDCIKSISYSFLTIENIEELNTHIASKVSIGDKLEVNKNINFNKSIYLSNLDKEVYINLGINNSGFRFKNNEIQFKNNDDRYWKSLYHPNHNTIKSISLGSQSDELVIFDPNNPSTQVFSSDKLSLKENFLNLNLNVKTNNANIKNVLSHNGNINIKNGFINSNLSVENESIINSDFCILGNIYITGKTIIGQKAVINNNMSVGNDITILGLDATDNIIIQGNSFVNNDVNIKKMLITNANIIQDKAVLSVGNNLNLNNLITKELNIKHNLIIENTLNCLNNLIVDKINFNHIINNNDLQLSKSLSVSNLIVANNISISGSTNISKLLSNNLKIRNILSVNQHTSIKNDLSIGSNVEFTNNNYDNKIIINVNNNITCNEVDLSNFSFGNNSHSEGISLTFGNNNKACGNFSLVIGNNSINNGFSSVVSGDNLLSRTFAESVFGYYNKDLEIEEKYSNIFNLNHKLFIVGYGTSYNRKNAIEILKNGKVFIDNSLNIRGNLHLYNGYIKFEDTKASLDSVSFIDIKKNSKALLLRHTINSNINNVEFGKSLASSINLIVVGQPGTNSAMLYKTTDDGNSWNTGIQLIPTDNITITEYGNKVTIYSNGSNINIVAVTGNYSLNSSVLTSIFIFYSSNQQDWIYSTKITPDSLNENFASNIDLTFYNSEFLLSVGAPMAKNTEGVSIGKVYIFKASSQSSTWIAGNSGESRLTHDCYFEISNPNNSLNDYFGRSIKIDKNFIIIGAPGIDNSLLSFTSNAGGVYIFKNNNNKWIQVNNNRLLNIPNSNEGTGNNSVFDGDYYGSAVDINNNLAIISAQFDSSTDILHHGSAYIFKTYDNGNTWDFKQKLLAFDLSSGDSYGGSSGSDAVRINHKYAVVGADQDRESNSSNLYYGSVYVYLTKTHGETWEFIGNIINAPDYTISFTQEVPEYKYFGFNVVLTNTFLGITEHKYNNNGRVHVYTFPEDKNSLEITNIKDTTINKNLTINNFNFKNNITIDNTLSINGKLSISSSSLSLSTNQMDVSTKNLLLWYKFSGYQENLDSDLSMPSKLLHLKFDNNITEELGNTTISSGTLNFALGHDNTTNGSLFINNNNVVVSNPSSSLIGDIAISLWINTEFIASSINQCILSKGEKSEFEIILRGTNIEFSFSDDSGSNVATQSYGPIQSGKWYNIFVQRTRTSSSNHLIEIYVNNIYASGQSETFTGTTNFTITSSDNDIVIGKRLVGASIDNFRGRIDDVRIYNGFITEIQIAYANGYLIFDHSLNSLHGFLQFDSDIENNFKEYLVADQVGNSQSAVQFTNNLEIDTISAWRSLAAAGINDGFGDPVRKFPYINNNLDFTSNITICFWIKYTNTPYSANDIIIAVNNINEFDLRYIFPLTSGTLPGFRLLCGSGLDANNRFYYDFPFLLTQNQWTHVGVIREGSGSSWTVNLYINGFLNLSLSTPTFIGTNGITTIDQGGEEGSITYNNIGVSSNKSLNANLDDIRLYDININSNQINTIYNNYELNYKLYQDISIRSSHTISLVQDFKPGEILGNFVIKNTNVRNSTVLGTCNSHNVEVIIHSIDLNYESTNCLYKYQIKNIGSSIITSSEDIIINFKVI